MSKWVGRMKTSSHATLMVVAGKHGGRLLHMHVATCFSQARNERKGERVTM